MINQLNNFKYRLFVNNVELDLFDDEIIKISNNITDLFDISTLPSEITNDISVPGTKKNNDFFKHYYDISIENTNGYSTNKKLDCYITINDIFVIEGYMILNFMNLMKNYVESYNITIYGSLSYFGKQINNKYLSDLTSLNNYNHNLTYSNVKNSWNYQLFGGNIVYPLCDYGQKIFFNTKNDKYGIDNTYGSLTMQDFKPSIKVKVIFDAIFNELGYTYTSKFLNESGYLDNAYFLLNKKNRYPIFDDIDLEDYGCIKIQPVKETLNNTLTNNVKFKLPYYSIIENNNNLLNSVNLKYKLEKSTKLRGVFNINFKLNKTGSGKGVPQFSIIFSNNTHTYTAYLTNINNYFKSVYDTLVSQNIDTPTQEYTLEGEFDTPNMVAGEYNIYINYTHYMTNNFSIILDPSTSVNSYFEIKKLLNIADNKLIKITDQFPLMKQIDFIKSIQKKFNLIIYPDKTKLKNFIIETWNDWYKRKSVYDFNKFIDINSTIKITPANNLAYKNLTFKDNFDSDYVSKSFKDKTNREYGMEEYTDDINNFSQDDLEVKTDFSFSPIVQLQDVGVSGEVEVEYYYINAYISSTFIGNRNCRGNNNEFKTLKVDIFSQYDLPYDYNGSTFFFGVRMKTTETHYDYYGNPIPPIIKYSNLVLPIVNGKKTNSVEFLYEGSMMDHNGECYSIKNELECISVIPDNFVVKTTSQFQKC